MAIHATSGKGREAKWLWVVVSLAPKVDKITGLYCTISIDSAWGVTCDQMDEILTTSNVGVTSDKV